MSESIREMLAREAAEALARAEAEERGEAKPMPGQRGRKRAPDPSQVYAVRIPVSRLRELRRIAEELDTPPTVLIRQWVLERLDELTMAPAAQSEETTVHGRVVKLGRRRQRDDQHLQAEPESGLERRHA